MHLVTWAGLMNPHTFWVQAPHVSGFQGVVGADLDLVLQDGVWETLKEKLVDCHVEGRDDFLQKGTNYSLISINMLSNSHWRNKVAFKLYCKR